MATLFFSIAMCHRAEATIETVQTANINFKNELFQTKKILKEQQNEILILNEQLEKTEKQPMKYLGKFTLTFYTKEQFPNSNTASGVLPVVGVTCAVDKTKIKLGTPLYIDGFGVRFAQDTGGVIKDNKIDVFVQTNAEAKQLGVKREVDVWVIE